MSEKSDVLDDMDQGDLDTWWAEVSGTIKRKKKNRK